MHSESPLVTIVTPTLNAGRYLKDTIESVLEQDYPNIEYLVVDSHSKDDTQDILRNYNGRLRTILAPRLGPATAIHTGLLEARGSILTWLNADDTYAPGAVSTAVKVFQEHSEIDVIYGDANWIDENGRVIRSYPTIAFDEGVLARDCFISQPASFFRASAYRRCPLDPTLSLSFDYDLWIRMTASQLRFEYVPKCLASSRMHSDCLTIRCRREVFEVTMELLKKHYGYIPMSWIFGYLSHRWDGRDQFFEPLRFSAGVFLVSLPLGVIWNPSHPLRAIGDWGATAGRGFRQKLPRLAFWSQGAATPESLATQENGTEATKKRL